MHKIVFLLAAGLIAFALAPRFIFELSVEVSADIATGSAATHMAHLPGVPAESDIKTYAETGNRTAVATTAPDEINVCTLVASQGELALLATIREPESANRYNVLYGGAIFDSYADHPRTLVQIVSGPNRGRKTSAAGGYQFLQRTWDEWAKKLSLPDFSPACQDTAALALARHVYRLKTGRRLADDLATRDAAVIAGVGVALSGTWTSLPDGIEQTVSTKRFVESYLRNLAGAATT